MSEKSILYQYDIHKKQVVNECNLYPTEVKQEDTHWLYALNNKYEHGTYDGDKVGKWMIFLSKEHINPVWDKIKAAVRNGDLWQSKVSTTTDNPEKASHAIMIYTTDYTDLDDVISVLDFLEQSEIKPPHINIKYKTDQQTLSGIYSGGSQKPWIYTSNSIRYPSTRTSAARGSSNYNWRDRSHPTPAASSHTPARGNSYNWRDRTNQF